MTGLPPSPSPPACCLDVEASGFGRGSYPIEVGIALPDGARDCWLIRPAAHWVHWDPAAERIHGIALPRLLALGRPPVDVARALNRALAGQVVYSDAWGNDMPWLAMLFDEAGLAQQFRLESIRTLLTEADAAAWHPTKDRIINAEGCERHRASWDAMILQRTLQAVRAGGPEKAG